MQRCFVSLESLNLILAQYRYGQNGSNDVDKAKSIHVSMVGQLDNERSIFNEKRSSQNRYELLIPK